MNVFLIYVRDENYYRLLPQRLNKAQAGSARIKMMAFPPLGIQVLAPVLRRHGHQVRMFDMCHPQMQADHIVQAALAETPDVVALSFLSTTTYPAAKDLARLLKSAAPAIPIIAGGVFATINAGKILKQCPFIDCVAVGEGEELLPDYLDNLAAPGQVAGLVWRSGQEIVSNPPRPLIMDLDKFPYPDRTTLPIDYIESLPLDVPAVLSLDKFCTMQTSRGCPFDCIYCDIPFLSQRRVRSRSAAHVLGEMQQLHDQGYRSIYFTDDHFLLNGKRIHEICSGIIERKLKFQWGCEGRVDAVAVDQLPIMSRANCKFLAFGVESGSQAVLERLNKNQTLAGVERAISQAKRQGIKRVHGFFVIGSPGEQSQDVLASFRFAARLKLDTFGFNRLCVYRGAPLWEEYVRRGIIDDERDWDKWFKCSDIDPTVLPGEDLNSLRMQGYGRLFARRILQRPLQTVLLLVAFSRYMKFSDLFKLLRSPFQKRILTRKATLTAGMDDAGLTEPNRGLIDCAPPVITAPDKKKEPKAVPRQAR